jgi:hypothetical protein
MQMIRFDRNNMSRERDSIGDGLEREHHTTHMHWVAPIGVYMNLAVRRTLQSPTPTARFHLVKRHGPFE